MRNSTPRIEFTHHNPQNTTLSDPSAPTDRDLLVALLGDEAMADAALQAAGGSLTQLASLDTSRLRMIGGMGLKRAKLLRAAAEFGRRVVVGEQINHQVIRDSKDVVQIFRPQMEVLTHEECWAVYLTASNRIIERLRISQGGVNATVVDHRLVVKRALELLASKIILVHNHPSGSTEPSAEDSRLTERLFRAAALFDIRLLDHIIISREGDYSFLNSGNMPE